MNKNLLAIIITHGRPDHVRTLNSLREAGYTGPVAFLLDTDDTTYPQYVERFGLENVFQFSKNDIEKQFPPADNFNNQMTTYYARNACFDLADKLGYTYHIQLDDDYRAFEYRHDENLEPTYAPMKNMDDLLATMLEFMETTPTHSIALAQGGDFIGGAGEYVWLKRKAMNSFICHKDRRFPFLGGRNEDVNTYITLGMRGLLFFTYMSPKLQQLETQSNPGGMTEVYLDMGTYVKTFYTVMHAPQCTKVSVLVDHRVENANPRIHHKINWNLAVPKIIREALKK